MILAVVALGIQDRFVLCSCNTAYRICSHCDIYSCYVFTHEKSKCLVADVMDDSWWRH